MELFLEYGISFTDFPDKAGKTPIMINKDIKGYIHGKLQYYY